MARDLRSAAHERRHRVVPFNIIIVIKIGNKFSNSIDALFGVLFLRIVHERRREVIRRMDEVANETAIFLHADAVEARHRFPEVVFRGETWDLRHLDAFALRMDPDLGFEVDVVVLFTCHCFTHSIKKDVRAPFEIPPDEIYQDAVERRVLCKERYDLSRKFLPGLVKDLSRRTVRYAGDGQVNYFTAEAKQLGAPGVYAVFFEVERDKRRKRRLLLYVQSAYRLERLSNRLAKAGKVRFATLLRKTYEGR